MASAPYPKSVSVGMWPGETRAEANPYSKESQLARGARRYTRKVASAKRWQAIIDAKQGPCRVCGNSLVEYHHLVSRALGGADTESNLVALCRGCHALVEARDKAACAALRRNLTDAEYAYSVDKLGESRFEQRYPVEYRRA